MSISSGAADGIRADSAAKESEGLAATLGSQTAAAADEVIVPDAIGSNNEGDLVASPTYVGRMIAIRPWEMKLVVVPTVQAGGSGYAVNDTIDLNGVAGVTGAPVLNVDAVSSGAVTAVSITEADGVQIRRGAMTSAPSPADNPVGQAATSGGGTGATFNCIWTPHFEIRFVTADATNTLTVNEDWIVPAVSGDNWAVSYVLGDYETKSGCTLRQQSGVFEFSRRTKVGPEVDTARRGWLALNDGQQMEMDNVADNGFELANGAIFTVGYEQGGESINGAYISTSSTAGVNFELNVNPGAFFFIHDLQMRSPREQVSWAATPVSTFDADERLFRKQVGAIIKRSKLFDASVPFVADAYRMQDVLVQPSATDFNHGLTVGTDNGQAGVSLANVNGLQLLGISDAASNAFGGLVSLRTTFSSPVIYDRLRNIAFLSIPPPAEGASYVEVEENETWQLVNPVWGSGIILDGQRNTGEFRFKSLTGTSIEERMSVIIRPVTAAGVAISGVHGYIFEGSNGGRLLSDNTEQSDSAAFDPIADSRFEVEIDEGDVAYFADVITRIFTAIGTGINDQVLPLGSGDFAWRGYDYGNVPVTVVLSTADVGIEVGGLELGGVFLVDDAITETDQATALTNPTTNPVVTRHAPGESDALPMKALAYDAGVGGVAPSLAEVLTQGSATGVVVAVEGDDVSGTVLLDTWNGIEFADNQNITGGTSAFDATTDTATFYEEYTWEVNANGETLTVTYDYLAARMAEATLVAPFDDALVWGGNDPAATQLLFLGSGGYFTRRSIQVWNGRIKPGTTRDFTDDFDRANEGLSDNADWEELGDAINDLQLDNNEVRDNTSPDIVMFDAVVEATFNFADDHYAEAAVNVLPANNETICVSVRSKGDTSGSGVDECYAGGIDGQSGTDVFIIAYAETGGSGDIQIMATGASLPATNDQIRLVVIGNRLILLVNDVVEVSCVDDRIPSGGQPGLCYQSASPNVGTGRLDDFGAGDYDASIALGEGVWVHDRGAGTFDFLTSDAGVQFAVPVTVSITITVLDDDTGSPIEDAQVLFETVTLGPPEATLVELINEKTPSSGIVSTSTPNDSTKDVRLRVRFSSGSGNKYQDVSVLTQLGLTDFSRTVRMIRQPILEGQN